MGQLIVGVEGPVLAGKTTMIAKLHDRLRSRGHRVQSASCFGDFAETLSISLPNVSPETSTDQVAAVRFFLGLDAARRPVQGYDILLLDRTYLTLLAHTAALARSDKVDAVGAVHSAKRVAVCVMTTLFAATIPIVVLIISLATEGGRARRRRLADERLSAVVAVLSSADRRRRQLGVLLAMSNRLGPPLVDVFSLKSSPADDVADALNRYALILDDASDARARVHVLMPGLVPATRELEKAHRTLRRAVSGQAIGTDEAPESIADRESAFATWRAAAEAAAQDWVKAARIELKVEPSLSGRIKFHVLQ